MTAGQFFKDSPPSWAPFARFKRSGKVSQTPKGLWGSDSLKVRPPKVLGRRRPTRGRRRPTRGRRRPTRGRRWPTLGRRGQANDFERLLGFFNLIRSPRATWSFAFRRNAKKGGEVLGLFSRFRAFLTKLCAIPKDPGNLETFPTF